MEHIVKFAIDDIQLVEAENYPTDEFAIAKIGFLGSNPNSHKLDISNEVLIKCASSVLGKFLVADINPLTGDATTHTASETIVGYFPMEQSITFVEQADSTLRAYAFAVVSKIYAVDFCKIFEDGDARDVSVEMLIETENDNELDDTVLSFNIVGVTALGLGVKPSSPGSSMEFTRFSEEDATKYFENITKVEIQMAEEYVNHPIDTSKEAVYDGDWDGDKAKQDLVKEEKFTTLAPKVCLRLEEGWKERQVTKLGYPVMCLHDGKWVYSRKGLASALGYAKQHDDNDIVNKVEALYKKLGLDSEGKEESAKMNEIEFAAVNIGDMWDKLYTAIRDARHWDYCIEAIYEEDNQKFALLRDENGDHYRLDFSLTEEGLTIAEEVIKVEIEIVETDEIRRFADPENIADYQQAKMEETCPNCGKPMSECECTEPDDDDDDDDDKNIKMSEAEMLARIAELEVDIENRDNIIMEKDVELEELRAFKAERLAQDRDKVVAAVMASVEEFMDKDEFETNRAEGLACEFAQIDAWSNKVKASIVDKALKKSKKNVDFTRIAGGFESNNEQPKNVWDRIK